MLYHLGVEMGKTLVSSEQGSTDTKLGELDGNVAAQLFSKPCPDKTWLEAVLSILIQNQSLPKIMVPFLLSIIGIRIGIIGIIGIIHHKKGEGGLKGCTKQGAYLVS